MTRDELLERVLPHVGGADNARRTEAKAGALLLTVKDRSMVDLPALQSLPGVESAALDRARLTLAVPGLEADKNKEETKMAVDNKKIAQDVLAAVGGKGNVTSAAHCMTRLRLTLKDDGIPKDEEVKNIPGVLGIVRSGGQYQIIIGQNVPKVYAEVCASAGLAPQEAIDENLDGPRPKLTLKRIGGNILDYLAGSMMPLIPVLMAAGLFKALLAVLGPELTGLLTAESPLYILLDFLYDAGFYFLPILIGYNAAKKLNIPAPLGAYMGCILMAPDFAAMAAEGAGFSIFGLPVVVNDYSQTMLPIVVSVAFVGLVYKLLARVMPDVLSTIATPFLTMLIAAPVSLLWLAPIGTFLSDALGDTLLGITNATGVVGMAFVGAIWEFLVMSGMHIVILMPFMMQYFEAGSIGGAWVASCCATWACFGVALGAFLRLKNKEKKSMCLGFFISGIVGGVTEPALYGLCFQYRRCFLGLMVGGAVGSLYAGITNVLYYVMSSSNFLDLLAYSGGSTANMVNGCIAMMLAMFSAAIATYFIGFSKQELAA